MIISKGYSVEVHQIETEDGYILTAWRIGKNNIISSKAVVLQHGLLDSSVTWFIDKRSVLPFFLVDNGYNKIIFIYFF